MAEAHRASSAGRFDEAASAYGRAGKEASRERDRDHALLFSAVEKSRAGDVAGALTELDALGKRTPKSPDSAEAAYKAAVLRRRTGAEARGNAELEAFVTTFAESPLALPALAHVLHEKEKAGPEAARGYLATLEPKLPADSAVLQKVAYERAQRQETDEARRDALVAVAARFPYPKGSYWDDSLFKAAEIEERLGRHREAIALYEKLLAERETSDVIGSYQRPKYSPAKMRIAHIQAEKLGDRAAARKTLHEIYTQLESSDLRDDALFEEARLYRADKLDDDACRTLDTLVSHFKDSRFVPCATAECPKIARPKDSKAPAVCRPYILRSSGEANPREASTTDAVSP
jgi:TolA-binding protein